jgi:hypothetical protein
LNPDEVIANPQGFSKEEIINFIGSLSDFQKMRLKRKVKKLLRDETSLPFSEQNSIFIHNFKMILEAIEDLNRENVTYNLIELIGLKDRLANHLLKSVKREEANIRKILNVYRHTLMTP